MFASLIAAMLLLAQTAWHANCPDVTAADFNSGRYDGQCVRLRATVVDAFVDATNADYVFLVLRCADGCVYAFIKRDFLSLPPERLVGAEVAPCGCVRAPPNSPQHRQAQRLFDIPRRDTFVVTRPAPGVAELPDLATAESCRPDELPSLGRRSVRGVVAAVWNGGRSLLLDTGGRIVRADLGLTAPPAVGDAVVAVGFPETDLQNLNLSRAVWQTQTNRVDVRRPAPRAIAFTDLLRDSKGRRAINCTFHGRPVSFIATVRSRIDEEPSGRFLCGDAHENVSVDLSASLAPHPDLRVGDTVHTLLCIIRELAVNAIRHGGATRLQVAGTIRGGRLFVSVRDDGCGFDPATAPGVTESHFGLQGVRERISNLAGVFTLVRMPRGGMRATVELAVPQAKGGT